MKLDLLSIKFTSGFMIKTKKKLISNTTLFSKNIKKESITNSYLSFINIHNFILLFSFNINIYSNYFRKEKNTKSKNN
jgi:hypothetical protein